MNLRTKFGLKFSDQNHRLDRFRDRFRDRSGLFLDTKDKIRYFITLVS